jgi:RNA polymerase sigma factor (TIGR02999 family)
LPFHFLLVIFRFMSELPHLINAVEQGQPQAAHQLLPLVYDELRVLAALHLRREKAGQTLQATALVHEAYLRLVGARGEGQLWDNRGHFFAAAAQAMRRILVDHARRKAAVIHGGGRCQVSVDDLDLACPEPREDLLALDEAVTRFAAIDRTAADLVQLRYFAGLSIPEGK